MKKKNICPQISQNMVTVKTIQYKNRSTLGLDKGNFFTLVWQLTGCNATLHNLVYKLSEGQRAEQGEEIFVYRIFVLYECVL